MEIRKQQPNVETRFVAAPESRAKVVNADTRTIRGYGIVFNSESVDLRINGRIFREIIRPEAVQGVDFTRVLSMHNHKSERLIGNTASGTMRTGIDTVGVWYEVDVPASPTGEDVYVSVSRGDISGSSFQFDIQSTGEKWSMRNGVAFREVIQFANVYEMGPVSEPAYPDTSVSARSLELMEAAIAETDTEQRDDAKELMGYIVSNTADFISTANWMIRYCANCSEMSEEYARIDPENTALYTRLKSDAEQGAAALKSIIETQAQIISSTNSKRTVREAPQQTNTQVSAEKDEDDFVFQQMQLLI